MHKNDINNHNIVNKKYWRLIFKQLLFCSLHYTSFLLELVIHVNNSQLWWHILLFWPHNSAMSLDIIIKLSYLPRRDVDVVDDQTQWQRAIEEEVQEAR